MGAVYSLAGETADVGVDAFSPVTDDYDPWDNAFTGTIKKITVTIDEKKPALNKRQHNSQRFRRVRVIEPVAEGPK